MEIKVLEVKRNGVKNYITKEVPDDYFEQKTETVYDENITLLKETKADKTQLENMWEEMASAYTSGVNSI